MKGDDAEGEDRLSSFGDGILHKIMSFMDTKYAVQTCVLSKRWKFLWRTLPYLDFNAFTFPCQDTEPEDGDELKLTTGYLCDFITQFLFRRRPTKLLRVFFSGITYERYGFILEGLLFYAVENDVEQIFVHSFSTNPLLLPQSLFTYQSLKELYLHLEILEEPCRDLPKFLVLPALTSLHLRGFSMTGPNFEPCLFSGCPNLETLELFEIFIDEHRNICVYALKLKTLKISFERAAKGAEIYRCNVMINAPKLTTFKYCGYGHIVHSTDNLPCLDYVRFYLRNSENKDEEYALQLINTCKQFRHAKSLTLSSPILEVLAMFPSLLEENRLPFANLKRLIIKHEGLPRGQFVIPANVMNYFVNSSTIFRICWLRYGL